MSQVARRQEARPKRPSPSYFAVIGITVAVVLTIVTAWDWEYGIGFSLGEVFTNLTNNNLVVAGIPNADLGQMLSGRSRGAFFETLQMAVLGTAGGAIVALPFALWTTTVGAPNGVVMWVLRMLSNVLRSFPDLLWAALFVAAVGIGALSGLLALFFFSIAVIVKLTADTLDGIDMGPIEAARAAGAGHSQVLRTAVVPQILPAYASFVLYSFELNLRGAAVLGLVGAGGLG
ncbi:MAG: ABC transporter permease subunit, partial [Actinomycetota bacterium]|nr:ABC transporter permease subunit [Actinomycetota bacterium]